MAPIDLDGTWKLVKNENLDAFLKAMGLNFAVRKMAAAATPVLEITQKGDVFKVISKGVKTHESNYTVGQEFTDKNPLNEKETSTYSPVWDGDKLRIDNKSNPEAIHVVRELIDGQLVQTQTIGSGDKAVVSKRIFAKK
ncbi:fatty acid-binding protein, heart-like [Patiria miniata]|uniref:Lipocalin/cytosolic fatty-acid binding domain-containing protein n=1 Tax=Patiria miniata TaxID=46514 RepID=A0A914AVR9_PATMI|nr:fatty acid-binding protein, heart-like [Patiria miniata]